MRLPLLRAQNDATWTPPRPCRYVARCTPVVRVQQPGTRMSESRCSPNPPRGACIATEAMLEGVQVALQKVSPDY